MRTSRSTRPQSSASGSGRSRYCVSTITTTTLSVETEPADHVPGTPVPGNWFRRRLRLLSGGQRRGELLLERADCVLGELAVPTNELVQLFRPENVHVANRERRSQ